MCKGAAELVKSPKTAARFRPRVDIVSELLRSQLTDERLPLSPSSIARAHFLLAREPDPSSIISRRRAKLNGGSLSERLKTIHLLDAMDFIPNNSSTNSRTHNIMPICEPRRSLANETSIGAAAFESIYEGGESVCVCAAGLPHAHSLNLHLCLESAAIIHLCVYLAPIDSFMFATASMCMSLASVT